MNEREVIEVIRRHYCHDRGNGPTAVLLPQVRDAAGFHARRTADALVMHLWPSKGLAIEGFEVKCSRSDVLREFKDPTKAEPFARYCDRWWLVVADASMVKAAELPEGWGAYAVDGDRLRVLKRATRREVPDGIPRSLLASILRQADRSFRPPAVEEEQ